MKKSLKKLTKKALICVISALFAITFTQAQVDFTADSVCLGNSTHLTAIYTGSYPVISYKWDYTHDTIFNDASGLNVAQIFFADTIWIGLRIYTTNDSQYIYKKVIIHPNPTAYFLVVDSVQCLNTNNFKFKGESTITSGTVSNFWRFGDGNTSPLDSLFHSYSSSGYKTAWLIASSAFGCKDSISQNVHVLGKPKADFAILDTTLCPGQIFQFLNTSTTPVTPLTFHWTFGDGGSGYSISDTIHSYAANGNYNVKLVAMTPAGCKDSITKIAYVSTTMTIDFNINKANQCLKGNSYTFTSNSSVCGVIDSIKWDLNNDNIPNDFKGNPATKVFAAATTYNIKMVVYSGVLKDSAMKLITVSPSPAVSFTINDSVQDLVGNSFVFTDNSTLTPAGPMTRMWYAGDGNTSAATPYIHSYAASNTFNVKLKVTAGSCSDSLIKNAYVFTATIPNFTAPTVCFGHATTFTNTSVISNPLVHIYWALDNDSIFNDKADIPTFNYTYLTPGTRSVGIRVLTMADTTIIYKTINVLASPKPGFTINSTSQNLPGNNFIVTDTSKITPAMGLTTKWDFGDAFTSTNSTENHSYAAVNNYNIKLVSTAANTCKDSVTKTVNVFLAGLLYPDFTADTVCFGSPTTLTSTSLHSDPILHYNWALDPDSLFNDNPDDSIVIHTFTTAGPNIVGLEVITATDTQRRFVTIMVNYMPVPDFTINKDTQLIYSNNFVYTNTTSLNLPDTFGSYWEYGDGGFSFAKNPAYTYLDSGTYNVKLIVTSNKGCKDSITKTVRVVPVIIKSDFKVLFHCLGDTTIFQNLDSVTNDTVLMYLWDFGDGYGSNDTSPKHRFDSSKTYFVKLIILTKHGFKDSIIKAVSITPHPTLNLSYSGIYYFFSGDTVMIYETYNLTATLAGLYDSILWSTGSVANNITVDTSGKYWVYAADTNGCGSDTAFILKVNARKPLQFRNVFTPNDDGKNDLWRVFNIEMYIPAKITIFNRWGMEVYSSNDYKNDWNGESKGEKLPQGTYYYILETKDGKILKGAVNILR